MGKNNKIKLRQILAVFVALLFIATPMANIAYAANETTFSDVPVTHGYYEFIETLYQEGVVQGFSDGSFGVNRNITRGQAAKMIVGALGLRPVQNPELEFTDVSNSHEYAKYIAATVENDIFFGYGDGRFGLHKPLTRRQIADVMVRALNLDYGDIEVNFTDIDNLPEETRTSIEILASNGIVSGYPQDDGTALFKPNNNTTRGQFSKILVKSREVANLNSDEVNVTTVDQLNKALEDTKVKTINLTEDIEVNITIARALTINFGESKIIGDVTFDYDTDGMSVLNGESGTRIEGNLTVNTPNASFTNGVEISGEVIVEDVEIGTWVEEADGNKLKVTDSSGATITIVGSPSEIAVLEGASGDLKITVNSGASVKNIVSKASVMIEVAEEAVVENIIAEKGADGSTITNNGSIKELNVDAPINLVANKAPENTVVRENGEVDISGEDADNVDVKTEANVSNLDELLEVLSNSKIETINITKDIENIPSPVLVERAVTINGNGNTLSFTGLEEAVGNVDDGLIIYAEATVKNLIVDAGLTTPSAWVGTYAIHIYNTVATLNDVTATGGNGGILVNGSNATLMGTIDVSNNGFGGIEVSIGKGLEDTSLDVTRATLKNTTEAYGLPTIWEDKVTNKVKTNDKQFTTNSEVATDQVQYYIKSENAEN